MREVQKGATSQSIYVEVLDSTSTTGARKTGLLFNTASLTGYYVRNQGSATSITLATLAAANSAWSSGGFKEVDGTNMPGVYRVDVPDAAFASGADSVVVTLKGATGMVQVSAEVQLVAWNPQDTVRGGLTALPNAAAEAAGGLYTRGSGAGQINQNNNGNVDVNAVRINAVATTSVTTINANQGTTQPVNFTGTAGSALVKGDAIDLAGTALTGRDIGASVLLSAGSGAGQLDFTSGVVKANLAQILGTALTETAGQIAAGFKQFFNIASPTSTMNTITTTTTATNLTTNNDKTGYALSAGGVTAVQSGLATAAALTTVQADTDDIQTRLPAALVSGRMDSSVGAMAANVITAAAAATDFGAEISAAVVDLAIAGHTTAGTVGAAINNAAGSGNPWDVTISGHTTPNTFGAKVNGLSGASGSGAITHTFTVTSGGNPVDGALVWVTSDSAGTNTVASATTDALGHATVFLDAGTYYAWAQRGGVNFTEGASFVVA